MTPKHLKVDIYEVEYSVSPGGEDCWEGTVYPKLGHTINYSDGKSAGEILDYIMKQHPGYIYDVEILDLKVYHEMTREEEDVFN